ncbi:MAG: hypothetical protein ABSE63_08195 [Thermoguttaceae bacterium]|jgi:hypothetical protein
MSFKFNDENTQKRFDELLFQYQSENKALAVLNHEKLLNNPDATDSAKNASLLVIAKIDKIEEQSEQRNGAVLLKSDAMTMYGAISLKTDMMIGDLLFDRFPGWLEVHYAIQDAMPEIYTDIISKSDDISQVRKMIVTLEAERAEQTIKFLSDIEAKRKADKSGGYNRHQLIDDEKTKAKIIAVLTADLKEAGHSAVSANMLSYVVGLLFPAKSEEDNYSYENL